MRTKRQIVETYILPCLLYSTETVAWTNSNIERIRVFENHMMRWMAGKKLEEHVPISDLKEITHLPNIMNMIRRKKLVWFGHLKRSSAPVKQICEGFFPGKRSRGRPSWRWMDDIYSWSGKTLYELNILTKKRADWRKLCYELF